jgi:hypothetical protein
VSRQYSDRRQNQSQNCASRQERERFGPPTTLLPQCTDRDQNCRWRSSARRANALCSRALDQIECSAPNEPRPYAVGQLRRSTTRRVPAAAGTCARTLMKVSLGNANQKTCVWSDRGHSTTSAPGMYDDVTVEVNAREPKWFARMWAEAQPRTVTTSVATASAGFSVGTPIQMRPAAYRVNYSAARCLPASFPAKELVMSRAANALAVLRRRTVVAPPLAASINLHARYPRRRARVWQPAQRRCRTRRPGCPRSSVRSVAVPPTAGAGRRRPNLADPVRRDQARPVVGMPRLRRDDTK